MDTLEPFKTVLLDLQRAVNIPLVVGGGFGLYLRQEQLRRSGERTLIEQLPEPRATNDIDLFVTMEVLVRVDLVRRLQEEIERLGFSPVTGAKYFQWSRTDERGAAKIDLLCGPLDVYADQLHTNSLPRVRPKAPKGSLRFHARQTLAAIELDDRKRELRIEGTCSDGESRSGMIYLPHSFTYLMMKLFAFDDRKDDSQKDVGQHHAMDLYRVLAMMTENEYEESLLLGQAYANDARLARARQIAVDYFANPSDLGMLRIRGHPLFSDELRLDEFGSALRELLSIDS